MREIKAVLLNDDEPAYLDQNSKLLLQAARQTFHIVSLDKTDVVLGRQSIQWFPWVGTRALRTLSLLAKSAKIGHETDQLSITYHLSSLEEFYAHLCEVTASKPDSIALARLLPMKAIGKFDDFAPEQLLDEANAQSRLDVSGVVEAAKAVLA
ncbi:MAG TPA: hypothetical protein VFY06_11595 [Verrucomicrobiae bacterium]|nr:hypothetical protein [Verrucomicrobiae bacterium]